MDEHLTDTQQPSVDPNDTRMKAGAPTRPDGTDHGPTTSEHQTQESLFHPQMPLQKVDKEGPNLGQAGKVALGLGAAAAAFLGYRALSKRGEGKQEGIEVKESVTINKPAQELYDFWRNFENLPQFMKHLESVTVQGDKRSHWKAKAPAGMTVEWDAEITDEQPGEMIAWRSLEKAQVPNRGSVRFKPASGDRGTEVHVEMVYNPPAGKLGAAVAKLFREEPNQQVSGDLRRFKALMEAGEIPTTEGQPHGQRSVTGKLAEALTQQ